MSFFGKNIKKIRTVKKLSQASFADLFDLKRGVIGAYEEGRAEAKVDTIISIAKYFELSVDQLLTKELTINEIYHINTINDKLNYLKSDNKQMYIPFVSITNKSKFIENYNNKEYLHKLPKISLPFFKQENICFECFNSSMLGMYSGIKQGDILITELIEYNDINRLQKSIAVIVLYNNDLVIGLPEFKIEKLILSPINMNFQRFYINKDKVKKVWKITNIITNTFLKEEIFEKRIRKIENKLNTL